MQWVNYSRVINGWAMAQLAMALPAKPVGDNGAALHLQIVYNKKKEFSQKKRILGWPVILHPSKKAKKQGEMPLPSLSPIPLYKMQNLGMGWDLGWVMAFPLVQLNI